MNDAHIIRKWQLCAEDENGNEFYLDEDNIFVGNSIEAETEGNRHCDDWGDKTGGLISTVKLISLGKVVSLR